MSLSEETNKRRCIRTIRVYWLNTPAELNTHACLLIIPSNFLLALRFANLVRNVRNSPAMCPVISIHRQAHQSWLEALPMSTRQVISCHKSQRGTICPSVHQFMIQIQSLATPSLNKGTVRACKRRCDVCRSFGCRIRCGCAMLLSGNKGYYFVPSTSSMHFISPGVCKRI
jgi:hypothetical protein